MKKLVLAVITLVISFELAKAQQPQNGGFENWQGNPAYPTGWGTVESASGFTGNLATQDATAPNHVEGLSAIRLLSDTLNTPFGQFTAAGEVWYGTMILDTTGGNPTILQYGVPFTARPDSFKYAYKCTPAASDSGIVNFNLKGAGNYIAMYTFYPQSTSGNWVYVSSAVNYANSNAIDTIEIGFKSSAQAGGSDPEFGSVMWVDDVKLVYNTTGIGQLNTSTEVSLSPNPASVLLRIWNTEITAAYKAQVYDLNGRLLLTAVPENNQLNVSDLPNGTYVLQLTSNTQQLRGRFIVVK